LIIRKTFPQVYALESPDKGKYWLVSARSAKWDLNQRKIFSTEDLALKFARDLEAQVIQNGKQSDIPKEKLQLAASYEKLVAKLSGYGRTPEEAENHFLDHVDYLRRLIEGEYTQRCQRVIERRVKTARFPVLETLEQFRWDWPKKINRLQVQNLFRLEFVAHKANVVLLGNVGVGKTHLATALGYAACQEGYAVLFADAISVINDLSAAHKRGMLKHQLKKYLAPELLVLMTSGILADGAITTPKPFR
jgi:hypothetical protein